MTRSSLNQIDILEHLAALSNYYFVQYMSRSQSILLEQSVSTALCRRGGCGSHAKSCFTSGNGEGVAPMLKLCFTFGNGEGVAPMPKSCFTSGDGEGVAPMPKSSFTSGNGEDVDCAPKS